MKKLDWYILKKFLGTFVFIIIMLMAITIVIDISEKIDNFVEEHLTVKQIILDFYIPFIPYMATLLAPFFILIAVIFFTSQLADRSEIIAILNSGTSFYRFLYPYFIGALILGTGLFICNNWLVPKMNKKRIPFEQKHIYKIPIGVRYSMHRVVGPGEVIYLQNYRPQDSNGDAFGIDKFEKGALVYKLKADRIEWIEKENKWRLSNCYIRRLSDKGDVLTTPRQIDTVLKITPKTFAFFENIKEAMTTGELTKYIETLHTVGQSDIEYYEVEKYRRTASAFSVFIMTLIGASLASRKVRGGLGWHLVLGIAMCASYEIIMKFSITFSTNSTLPPLVGVWIPNLLFGSLAFYLLKKAPK